MSKLAGRGIAVALLFLAGCGDPEVDPLAPGRMVVLSDGSDDLVEGWVDRGGTNPIERFLVIDVPSGTRAQVVEDEPAKPPVQALLRLVKVRLVDGDKQGTVVELARNKLRPAK